MNEASLAMALHLHQPIGNFESVIERAYKNCYSPFIELLSEYPDIKIALHVSGCLLDYFEVRHPSVLEKIKEMSDRGQIELLGGGYYEPILIAIPPNDLFGQIEMMREYIRTKFGCEPKGMWVPERVWAPRLALPLSKAGIRYCILDDAHLAKAGVKEGGMHGYFMTGKNGGKIAVFPSDKKLRYTVPFGMPSEVIGYFAEKAKRERHLLFIYGDDAEKFGEWPGTHKWVYEEKWLKKFFDELEKNNSWLKLVHFSDYLQKNIPLGELEIPEASYIEMMEWSGGSWLNFLRKYPEANQMHKKMYYVSRKLADAAKAQGKMSGLEAARRELYKAQCNCAYWHGVFGGLYLFHLRSAVYNHLITAEKIIDAEFYKMKKNRLRIREIDFDHDGKEEVLMENNVFSMCIDPHSGGVLKELDYKPLSANITNTLSRKEEAYHKNIFDTIKNPKSGNSPKTIHDDSRPVSPVLTKKLVYDKFPRYCLRSYFIREDLKKEDFFKSSFLELGDFAEGSYAVKKEQKGIILERRSRILKTPFKLSKQIHIKSENKIALLYNITKEGPGNLSAVFGIEFNVTMPCLNAARYRYSCDNKKLGGLNTAGSIANVSSFGISDAEGEFGISLNFLKRPSDIWYFGVETVSQSERAFELNYQCSCIFPRWKLVFNKIKSWNLALDWIMV